jgi:subtilase family serine protease
MDLPLFSLPLLPFFWVFFILSIFILQMVNIRNRIAANNAENNGENNNQDVNPLSPPLLTLEQVLAIQAHMLQTMQ